MLRTFSTVYFMESEYRSTMSDDSLAYELRCTINVKYVLDFEDQCENSKISH